jgi:hypothetical protein
MNIQRGDPKLGRKCRTMIDPGLQRCRAIQVCMLDQHLPKESPTRLLEEGRPLPKSSKITPRRFPVFVTYKRCLIGSPYVVNAWFPSEPRAVKNLTPHLFCYTKTPVHHGCCRDWSGRRAGDLPHRGRPTDLLNMAHAIGLPDDVLGFYASSPPGLLRVRSIAFCNRPIGFFVAASIARWLPLRDEPASPAVRDVAVGFLSGGTRTKNFSKDVTLGPQRAPITRRYNPLSGISRSRTWHYDAL